MKVCELQLLGIGYKVEIIIRNCDKILIIIYYDGWRELYYFDENDYEECVVFVQFDDVEVRQIFVIFGGMVYKLKVLERVEVVFDDLIIEWCKVEMGVFVIYYIIGDLDVRQEYYVMVIVIIKKNQDK